MPPKQSKPSKPNASRKRKSDEENNVTKPQASQKLRKLLPHLAKPRINPDGTITEIQQYTPGYGPYPRSREPAVGPNPAVEREPSGRPPFTLLVGNHGRQGAAAARYPVTHVRQTQDVRPAIPSPGMIYPPPPVSRSDGSSKVPFSWNAELEQLFQDSGWEQEPLQVEPPSTLSNDAGAIFNGLGSSWTADLGMPNALLCPNTAPLENGHNSAVQAPDTIFSSGHAPAPLPGSYNEVIDPFYAGGDGVDFGSSNLLSQMQQQQPQPPSQAQGTYQDQEGSYLQQPPVYAQLQYPTYTNGYFPQWQQPSFTTHYTTSHLFEQQATPSYVPPYTNVPLQQQQQQQQQQTAYRSPYANYYQQQHQPAPEIPLGYPTTYVPPNRFNNVVGNNNIVVNHVPSSSSSQNLSAPNTFDVHRQNAHQQLRVEVAKGWMRAAEEGKGVFAPLGTKKRPRGSG